MTDTAKTEQHWVASLPGYVDHATAYGELTVTVARDAIVER